MFYIVIGSFLGYLSLLNVFFKKKLNVLFGFLSIILVTICSLRYGGGTDYFSYRYLFYQVPLNIVDAMSHETHLDFGFKMLVAIFRSFNMSFELFVAILSIFIMGCYIYVINKYSKNKILSIFLLFTNYYLVYVESALRQGLAMSIFIIAYYKYLQDNNTKKYMIIILIISLFHKAALIALIIPLVKIMYYKIGNNLNSNIMILLGSLLLFLTKGERILIKIAQLIGIKISYQPGDANIYAILLRLVLLLILYIAYIKSDKDKISDNDKIQFYTYFINVCLFIAISNNTLFSRITDFISVIEIIVLANFISNINIKGLDILIISSIILIMGILFIKDISANNYTGGYYKKGIFDYPYVSVFDKEKIFKYRSINSLNLQD